MPSSSNCISFKDVEPYLAYLDFTATQPKYICTMQMYRLKDGCRTCEFNMYTTMANPHGCKFAVSNLQPLYGYLKRKYPELLI